MKKEEINKMIIKKFATQTKSETLKKKTSDERYQHSLASSSSSSPHRHQFLLIYLIITARLSLSHVYATFSPSTLLHNNAPMHLTLTHTGVSDLPSLSFHFSPVTFLLRLFPLLYIILSLFLPSFLSFRHHLKHELLPFHLSLHAR